MRAAIELEPRNVGAYMRLARMMSEEQRPAEAEEAYRRLAEIDPVEGGLRLYDHLRFADRKLSFHRIGDRRPVTRNSRIEHRCRGRHW